jgi:hypothetical protein
METYLPLDVIPATISRAVAELSDWFVIGGQAVRCFCPYRPSRDVDFGVSKANDLDEFLAALDSRGKVEILERSPDTVHLRFDGVKVSVFVLERLAPHVERQRLTVTGILATKMHAILDRGTRRDFFDLYVTLQVHQLGVAECIAAVRKVFTQSVHEPLLLKALTYFEDADREALLPGEGPADWQTVKEFFMTRVGQLLIPPGRKLEIQQHVVDVRENAEPTPFERG